MPALGKQLGKGKRPLTHTTMQQIRTSKKLGIEYLKAERGQQQLEVKVKVDVQIKIDDAGLEEKKTIGNSWMVGKHSFIPYFISMFLQLFTCSERGGSYKDTPRGKITVFGNTRIPDIPGGNKEFGSGTTTCGRAGHWFEFIRFSLVWSLILYAYSTGTYYLEEGQGRTQAHGPGTFTDCQNRTNYTKQLVLTNNSNQGVEDVQNCPAVSWPHTVTCFLPLIWIGYATTFVIRITFKKLNGKTGKLLAWLDLLCWDARLVCCSFLVFFFSWVFFDPYHFCDDNQISKWVWKDAGMGSCQQANSKIYQHEIMALAVLLMIINEVMFLVGVVLRAILIFLIALVAQLVHAIPYSIAIRSMGVICEKYLPAFPAQPTSPFPRFV